MYFLGTCCSKLQQRKRRIDNVVMMEMMKGGNFEAG